jgi:alkanesulfonate monooxygenase SsuD/methylene tetrahydromethanopterin reductase-like flavin-dependent oxidoreductase (luciferase family)
MQIFIYSPRMHAPELAVEEALRIEEMGYDGIAMPDHLFVPNFTTGLPNPYAHGPTILAAAAGATSRVKLTPFMASNLARGPVELAHAIATISRICEGRVELGIGTGWFRPQYDAIGVPFPPGSVRIERLVETVHICRSLFELGQADFQGRHYQVNLPNGAFIPLKAPVPITIGAAGPRAIEAAARVGDRVDLQPNAMTTGTLDLSTYNGYNEDLLRAAIERAQRQAASVGRDVLVSAGPFVSVAEDQIAGAAQRQAMASSFGMEKKAMDRSLGSIIGSAREVAERLAVYADAGCDRVHLQALDHDVAERLAPYLPQLKEL